MGDSSESSTAPRDSSNFSAPAVEDEPASYVTLDEIDTPSAPRMNNQASNTPPVAAVKAPIRDEDIKPKNFPPRAPSTSPVVVKSSPVVEKGKQPVEAPVAVQRKPAAASLNASAQASSRDVSIESFTSKRRTDADIEKSKSENTREFYSRQNSIIGLFEEVEKHGAPENAASITQGLDDDDDRMPVKIAIRVSFAVNVFLVFLKIFIAVRSNSMSVLASALDSILDIVSGSIMFVVDWLTRQQDKYSYPVGKKRLEPLGIIVFSTLMFTTALQILIEAFKRLSNHSTKINIEVYTLAGLIITIALKLLLYLYCRTVSGSSSVEALAQDHRNDVISNSVTIATALVAFYKPDLWYFDPIGGVAIGLYIMVVWVRTGFLTVRMMTGYVAPPDLIKKWTYLAMQHDPKVVAIDTVRGYHTSEGFVVELDIVLPEEMPLKEAHDIGEALQFKVEGLEEVERCFVHLDYETDHKPEH